MLLALLPLVGWAQTATLGQVAVGEYTYGNTTLPVPVVKDSEGAILVAGTHYTVSTKAYKDEACTQEVASLDKLEGGTTYYLKITGEGAYVGQQKAVHFTVKKKALKITVNTVFQRDYLSPDEPVINTGTDLAFDAFATTDPFADNFAKLGGTLTYTYAGKGNKDYPGGEYDITFSGLTSKNYEITYAPKKFKILGTDLSGEAVSVKAGTAFANKTYKGAPYTPADLTGLKLVWGTKELTQGTDFDIILNDGYSLTGDADIVDGKTYYTKEGVVYTAVATPVAADLDDYYELDADAYVGAQDWGYDVKFKGNYSGSKANLSTFTIVPAPVTVTCEDYEINYNGNDHKTDEYAGAVTFTWMGLVGADVANYATVTSSVNFTKPNKVQVGSEAINAGNYALKIEGGNVVGNYYLAGRLDGKLTIKKVDLTVKANDANKTIGADDPKFTLTIVSGLQTPDGLNTGATITFTRADGETAGSYDITPDVNTVKIKNKTNSKDRTGNYNIKLATPKGKLTIGKTAITVTFKNASKFYGQADPTFNENSYVVDGLQKGDALPAFTIVRENAGKPAGEAVGYYSISATIANPNTDKYTSVTVVPGALQIKKAQLTFTIPAQSVAKNVTKAALSKATIKVAGINNSDVAADLYDLDFGAGVHTTGDPAKTNADETVPAGIKATLKAAAQANYEVVKVNGVDAVDATYATGKLIVGTGTVADITFNSVDADYTTIQNQAGETQDVSLIIDNRTRTIPASTTHTWAAEKWNTMVLPFEVTVAELSAQLGYCIVNRVDKDATTEGNVQFKLEMQKIPANEPFCVKTSDVIADGTTLNFDDKLIVDGGENPSVDAGMGYKFVGAYKNKTIDKNNPTYNFLRGDNDKWAHIGSTSGNSWKVVPFDAYVELTEAAAARGVTFTFEEIDGTATVIKAVDAEEAESAQGTAAEGWYTINGIKLNAKPTQKGIYIFNGKKVAIQ